MNEQIQISREPGRFVIEVDGTAAGFAQYVERQDGAVFDFVHTEVDSAFSGRGLGGRLVEAALEETRELGKTIVPHCPFVADWLKQHPQFVGDVYWPNESPPVGD